MPRIYRANFMRGQHGEPGDNLTTIKVKLASGKTLPIVLHRLAAPSFKGFLTDLITHGCPVKYVYGYAHRNIRGSGRLSQHAYGNAIDINQVARNKVTDGLAEWMRINKTLLHSLEEKWNIEGGQRWRSPDAGHWEWRGPKMKTKLTRRATRDDKPERRQWTGSDALLFGVVAGVLAYILVVVLRSSL